MKWAKIEDTSILAYIPLSFYCLIPIKSVLLSQIVYFLDKNADRSSARNPKTKSL